MEQRRRGRQPRLQDALQGRLLPGRAVRPLQRSARRHGEEPRGLRPARRARAPRGRHGRPGGDQLQVRHAAPRRGRRDEVQVHHQEHRLERRQVGHLHAQADLRRQRLRHARAPVALEGRRAAVLRRGRLRRVVGHRAPARGVRVHRSVHVGSGRATTSWCSGDRERIVARPRHNWTQRVLSKKATLRETRDLRIGLGAGMARSGVGQSDLHDRAAA